MKDHERIYSVREGIHYAFDSWLYAHNPEVLECIEKGVEKAFSKWLEYHTEDGNSEERGETTP